MGPITILAILNAVADIVLVAYMVWPPKSPPALSAVLSTMLTSMIFAYTVSCLEAGSCPILAFLWVLVAIILTIVSGVFAATIIKTAQAFRDSRTPATTEPPSNAPSPTDTTNKPAPPPPAPTATSPPPGGTPQTTAAKSTYFAGSYR